MSIFEDLENLNVSEECFDDIMGIVEELIHEVSVGRWRQAAVNSLTNRIEKVDNKEKELKKLNRKAEVLQNKREYRHGGTIKDESKLPSEQEINQAKSDAQKAEREYKEEGKRDRARVNHATRVFDLDNKLDDSENANNALRKAHQKFNTGDGYKDVQAKKIIDTDPVRSRKKENRDEREQRTKFRMEPVWGDEDKDYEMKQVYPKISSYSRSMAKHGGRGTREGSVAKGSAFSKRFYESYSELLEELKRSAVDIVKAARNNYLDRKQDGPRDDRWASFVGSDERVDHAGALASLPAPKKSGVSARKL